MPNRFLPSVRVLASQGPTTCFMLAVALFGFLVASPKTATASPGALDVTFGTGGTVTTAFRIGGYVVTDVSGRYDSASALAILPDGKMMVAGGAEGVSTSSGNGDVLVARYDQNGLLDPSFGIGGIVTTDFGGSERAAAIALGIDGTIVIAGVASISSTKYLIVVRYTADGSLDASFSEDGKLVQDLPGGSWFGQAVAIGQDGTIVVGGHDNSHWGLIRYLGDGSLDTSFNGTGIVTTDFGSGYPQKMNSLALLADGSILAAGEAGHDFALARYTVDGALDTSFGSGGKVVTDFGATDRICGLVVQPDGKAVVAGSTQRDTVSLSDFALARYNTDGSLDATFGTDGKVTTDLGGLDAAFALVQQADGKLVALGQSADYFPSLALARYLMDGSPDTSFGDAGKVVSLSWWAQYDKGASGYALAVRADGTIIGAGTACYQYGYTDVLLAKYNLDGSPDRSFGLESPLVEGYAYPNGLAIQGDGKIVTAGYATLSGDPRDNDFALTRHNPDGTLDDSFGHGGRVQIDLGGDDRAQGMTLQPDGKMVVAGYRIDSGGQDLALARVTDDGSLDSSFGDNGLVSTDSGSDERAFAVAIQPDGKIVVAGSRYDGSSYDLALARYTAAGTLDASFGTGGVVTTDLGKDEEAYALAIQGDGKIVLGGYSGYDDYRSFALVRYTVSGALDATFGSGGIVTGSFYYTDDNMFTGVAIQPDGKIVAAGYAEENRRDFALARFTASGLPDASFGTNGKVTTGQYYDEEWGADVLVQSDGKIVVAGGCGVEALDFALVRYNPNGSIDTSFGPGGMVRTDLAEGDMIRAIALDAEGKIVAAGRTRQGKHNDFALARYRTAPLPSAVTLPASAFTVSSATLNAEVNASGLLTTVSFEYGTTTAYGNTMAASPETISGTTTTAVSGMLAGLEIGVTYHFRVVAVNSSGTTLGQNQSFVIQAPSDISLTPSTIREHAGVGWLVGILSSTDATPGDTFAYTLVPGTGSDDNSSFAIFWGNELRTTVVFDYESDDRHTRSVRVRSTDSTGLWFEKVLTVTITEANERPVATDDVAMTAENEPVAVEVLLNDSDPDGDPLSISAVFQPSHGRVTLGGSTVTYTPTAFWNGSDSFTYIVSDGRGLTDTARVSVTVTPVNHPPVLGPIGDWSMDEGSQLTIVLQATDPDTEDTVSLWAEGLPYGAEFDAGSGTFSWRPSLEQAGEYTVTFGASDGVFDDTEEVFITVLDHDPLLFADDFSDGTTEGDPDWEEVKGAWRVSDLLTFVGSATKINRALVQGLPLLDSFCIGAVQAKVKLPRTAVRAPNGGVLFHVLDGANYRYARLKKTVTGGKLIIGQVGDPAEDGSATFARSKKLRLKSGRFYELRLHLWDSGLVEAFVNDVKILEWSFPQSVEGRVGLTAGRSRSVFDDVQVFDETVLME